MNSEHIAVISARRPEAVLAMEKFLPSDATWYVANGEGDLYRNAGAKNVIESGLLVPSRNRALEDAFSQNKICIQISDDLTKIQRLESNKGIDTSLVDAIFELVIALDANNCYLAGCAPTANPFYGSQKIKTNGFIVGDLIAVKPTNLRFDTNLELKEDYDYTCQHLNFYGRVARCDFLLAAFKHRTNKGGAVSYRNTEREQAAINYLINKWPGAIKNNPRRENEVLLRWPKVKE